jgi:hypothetical protein
VIDGRCFVMRYALCVMRVASGAGAYPYVKRRGEWKRYWRGNPDGLKPYTTNNPRGQGNVDTLNGRIADDRRSKTHNAQRITHNS